MINVQLLIRELSYSYINGDSGQCRKMSVKNSNLKKCLPSLDQNRKKKPLLAVKATETTFIFSPADILHQFQS